MGQRVAVTGAGGFIGRFVVDELIQLGWSVRALVRPGEQLVMAHRPGLEVVPGDVRDGGALLRVFDGCSAVVNLAAAKADEPESEDVNVGGARRIVEACRGASCGRIIHISTQSVKIARQGVYARTKLAAEKVFEDSGLAVTILRPSIVYGPGRSGVFSTIQRFVERLPIVPVLGDGRWVSAPMHVSDVARAVVACLQTRATIGRCYDLGGPDPITFDELIDRIATMGGRKRRPKLHVPLGLSLVVARVVVRVVPRAPITVSNVLGSNQDTAIDLAPARRDFGFRPMPLDEGLRRLAIEQRMTVRTFPVDDRALSAEADQFARYVLDATPTDEIRNRYVAAVREIFGATVDGDLVFVRRHPWSLPLIDAATAVVRPRSQVRQRVFLMAAVLEASPQHAEFFLAPPPPRSRLLLGLLGRGASALAKIIVGGLLLPFVPRHAPAA